MSSEVHDNLIFVQFGPAIIATFLAHYFVKVDSLQFSQAKNSEHLFYSKISFQWIQKLVKIPLELKGTPSQDRADGGTLNRK